MDMAIEGLHEETGPGVMEAAIAVDKALAAADKAALFKTFAKVIAQKNGYMATFMAKCLEGLAGAERPHPPLAQVGVGRLGVPRGRQAAFDERRDALVRRRPAEADAGAAGHGRADDQFLPSPDPRLLGADGLDLGRREPHDGACA